MAVDLASNVVAYGQPRGLDGMFGAGQSARSLRAVLLACAVLASCLTAAAAALVPVIYDAAAERTMARSPDIATDGVEPTILWSSAFETVGEDYTTVIYLHPLTSFAPRPPGMAAWPQPGEVLLSPSLARAGHGIGHRYGRVVGQIGIEGLASPTERVAFVVPDPAVLDQTAMEGITGFGHSGYVDGGEIAYRHPIGYFYGAMLPFLVIGVIGLILGAARLTDGGRAHAIAVLTKLGASRRQIVRYVWSETRGPVLFGVAGALVILALASVCDLPIPGVGYRVRAADVRTGLVSELVALAAAFVVTVVLVVAVNSRDPLGRRRAGKSWTRRPPNRPLAFVALVALISIVPVNKVLAEEQMQEAATGIFIASMVVLLVGLPSLVGLTMQFWGWALARGKRAETIVAGRQLQLDARPIARLTGVFVLVLLVVTQAQMWSALLNWEPSGRAVNEFVDRTIAVADSGDSAALDALGGHLSPPYATLRVYSLSSGEVGLAADAGALAAIGLDAGNTSWENLQTGPIDQRILATLHEVLVADEETVRVSTDPAVFPIEELANVLVFRPGMQPIDLPALQREASAIVMPTPDLVWPGASSVVGAKVGADQARWVGFFGALGSALLALALLTEVVRQAQRLRAETGPLGAIAAPPAMVQRLVRLRTFYPLALGACLGVVVALCASYPLQDPLVGRGAPLFPVVVGSGVIIVGGYLIARSAGRDIAGRTLRWLPGDTTVDDVA